MLAVRSRVRCRSPTSDAGSTRLEGLERLNAGGQREQSFPEHGSISGRRSPQGGLHGHRNEREHPLDNWINARMRYLYRESIPGRSMSLGGGGNPWVDP